jgi:hypothetical protein
MALLAVKAVRDVVAAWTGFVMRLPQPAGFVRAE